MEQIGLPLPSVPFLLTAGAMTGVARMNLVVALGDEPFAGAAASAALTWRFNPARRDGQPVAARIDFQVSFQQETKHFIIWKEFRNNCC